MNNDKSECICLASKSYSLWVYIEINKESGLSLSSLIDLVDFSQGKLLELIPILFPWKVPYLESKASCPGDVLLAA